MVPDLILEAIAAHTRAVERGEVVCSLDRCPHCDQQSAGFKYHASRRRWFRVIVQLMVRRVPSAVTRWKCVVCRKTFTVYPDFAFPHKRYVRQDLCRLCGRYVAEDGLSYRKAVEVNGKAIYYDAAEGAGEVIDDRTLSHSALHRWISFLGALKQTLGQAWQLIRARSPSSELFRSSSAVPARKYRSAQRKGLLQACGRLLQADQAYRNLFGVWIFPYLGTVCRWS